jgi:hypothetical protein
MWCCSKWSDERDFAEKDTEHSCMSIMKERNWGPKWLCLRIHWVAGERFGLVRMSGMWITWSCVRHAHLKRTAVQIHDDGRPETGIILNVACVRAQWNSSLLWSHATECYMQHEMPWKLCSCRDREGESEKQRNHMSVPACGSTHLPSRWVPALFPGSKAARNSSHPICLQECIRETICTLTSHVCTMENQDFFLVEYLNLISEYNWGVC